MSALFRVLPGISSYLRKCEVFDRFSCQSRLKYCVFLTPDTCLAGTDSRPDPSLTHCLCGLHLSLPQQWRGLDHKDKPQPCTDQSPGHPTQLCDVCQQPQQGVLRIETQVPDFSNTTSKIQMGSEDRPTVIRAH